MTERPPVSSNWREYLSSVISMMVAIVGFAVAVGMLAWNSPETADLRDGLDRMQTGELRALNAELIRVRDEQNLIRQALRRSPENLQMRVFAERLESISRRQDGIERAIMANPARALELPMLRNDLNNMREVNEQRLEAIKAGVDQSYDMNKWLLGTIVITIIGLAVSNLLTRKA